MSKKIETIQKLTKNIEQVFELIQDLDFKNINKLKSLEKKSKKIQKQIEENTKDLGIEE